MNMKINIRNKKIKITKILTHIVKIYIKIKIKMNKMQILIDIRFKNLKAKIR